MEANLSGEGGVTLAESKEERVPVAVGRGQVHLLVGGLLQLSLRVRGRPVREPSPTPSRWNARPAGPLPLDTPPLRTPTGCERATHRSAAHILDFTSVSIDRVFCQEGVRAREYRLRSIRVGAFAPSLTGCGDVQSRRRSSYPLVGLCCDVSHRARLEGRVRGQGGTKSSDRSMRRRL